VSAAAATDVVLTARELTDEGERLVSLGRRLIAQASALAAPTDEPPPFDLDDTEDMEYSLGRNGVVNRVIAFQAATQLGTFTRSEFVAALGVTPSAAARWLNALLDHTPPLVERRAAEDGTARYVARDVVLPEATPRNAAVGQQVSLDLAALREARAAARDAESVVRQAQVAGTGKGLRIRDEDVRRLVAEAEAQGAEVRKASNGHFEVGFNLKRVLISSTPSNPRSVRNDRTRLRRIGLNV